MYIYNIYTVDDWQAGFVNFCESFQYKKSDDFVSRRVYSPTGLVVDSTTNIVEFTKQLGFQMAAGTLSKQEMKIMEVLWRSGSCSVREIQEALPEKGRPAYTTVQTVVYRLENKGAVRRAKKISNAHIFEAVATKENARGRIVDELLSLFGGSTQPLMSHLIETGKLTTDDVEEARKIIEKMETNEQAEKEKGE